MTIKRDAQGQPVALYLSASPPRPRPAFKRGERVLAFACWEWAETGDVGDNSQFWKPATVLRFYNYEGDDFVDLLFEGGRVKRGEFAEGVRQIAEVGEHG